MSKLRECGKKKSFLHWGDAVAFCFSLKRAYLDSASPYLCKHCGLWHVGHRRGKQRRRRK